MRYSEQMQVLITANVINIGLHGWPDAILRPVVRWGNEFGIAVSGSEPVNNYEELVDLFDLWNRGSGLGAVVWVAKKLKLMPIYRVSDMIREAGFVDIDALGLAPNSADEYIRAGEAGATREELDAIVIALLKKNFVRNAP